MKTMILLVGEQPIPNLLPVRHDKPSAVLFVHTRRTEKQTDLLTRLLGATCACDPLKVAPYEIDSTREAIRARLNENKSAREDIVFNLTGGTKAMAFAAYELAIELGCEFLYFQTEGGVSRIYRYRAQAGTAILTSEQEIGSLLTIEDYVRAHVGDYKPTGFSPSEGGRFEKAVYDALQDHVDEIVAGVKLGGAVDLDLVVRCGNQVGIAEVKTSSPAKDGIGQLTTAGGREYLGTFTRKFLIVSRSWERVTDLKELADAREIKLIELPSYGVNGSLSQDDTQYLREQISSVLRCKQ